MLTQWTRIIHSDNGTLTDLTLSAQNDDTMPLPLVSAEDAILVGTHFPVNNLFFDVNTVNSNTASLVTDIWTGVEYNVNADNLDETEVAGVTMSRSGALVMVPERDKPWNRVEDTSDSNGPTELTSLKIYNMYWSRLRVTADLSAGMILNKIGYRFANTQMLQTLDPDMDDYLATWESGKTNWDEQLQAASDQVIADMKSRGIILHPGQILRMDEVGWATAYRALMMIYPVLGTPLQFRLEDATLKYDKLMSLKRFTIDTNADGIEQRSEVINAPNGIGVR